MKIFFLIPFLLLSQLSFSQKEARYDFDYQIVYQMTYQTDSNNARSVAKEYMELLTNDDYSLFRSIKAGKIDSAMYSEFGKGNLLGPSMEFVMANYTTINYKVLKDKIKNETLMFDRSGDVKSSDYYIEPLDKMEWKILSDTTTINGIKCQKANLTFGNRNWSVWFAPDIPITDGPYKFAGLPGLIVRMSDKQNYWSFDMISLTKIQKTVIINFDKRLQPRKMDKIDFYRTKRHYANNSLMMDEASGLILGFSSPRDREIMLKNQKERALRDNNWIELIKAN